MGSRSLTPHFAAVIDGATSKSDYVSPDGKSTGRLAMELVLQAISELPPDADMPQAIVLITAKIHDFYVEHDLLADLDAKPNMRFTANGVIYSAVRHEIWQIGDCQCMVNGTLHLNEKEIDAIMADARAAYNEAAIALGETTLDDLAKDDPGRAFINPFLQRQAILQNHPNKDQPFAFPVFDGFKIHPEQVKVTPVAAGDVVVLASDGYPQLQADLVQSEDKLQAIMQADPNCMREYKSTKGLSKGSKSFDDRAYLKFKL